MGLYDIPYMLAVPGMTVTAPRNGTEMLGLLRAAVEHTSGPFSLRYPRDASPDTPPEMALIPATPYATWEVVRQGREFAILAVGTMVEDEGGGGRFTQAVLRPVATLAPGGDAALATALHEEAHRLCYIANSVNFPVSIEPTVVIDTGND